MADALRPNDVQRRLLAILSNGDAFLEVSDSSGGAGLIRCVPFASPVIASATVRAVLSKGWLEPIGGKGTPQGERATAAAGAAHGRIYYRLSSEGREALQRARLNNRR